MQNLNSSDGWGKNLANLPSLTLDKIVAYVERVNKTFITKSKKIEKHFQQGQQFLEENFIDLNSILSKQNDKYFSVKGICSVSLKQKDRWVLLSFKNLLVILNLQPVSAQPEEQEHAHILMQFQR